MDLAATILLVYQILISLIILWMFWITMINLLHFKRLPRTVAMRSGESPRVSILVPARNEERCIEACVASLCEQEYGNYEVIVLDDESTDATPQILDRLSIKYPSLTVIRGTKLPKGWVGKSWACHQLSQAATGDYLLFTDADTEHKPKMIAASVETMERGGLDFLTMIPHEQMESLAENAVIPVVHMMFFSYYPTMFINRSGNNSPAAANGQFIMFTREAYDDVGGHESVHDAIVEDVFLARVVKRHGKKMGLVDGSEYVSCRMYTNAREVTRGFSKNLFPGLDYSLPLVSVFLAHTATAFIGPIVTLIAGLYMLQTDPAVFDSFVYAFALFSLPIQQLVMAGIVRFLIAMRFSMQWWHFFIQPIAAIWTIMIGINSIRWAYSTTGSKWKGRSYTRGTTS